MQIIKIDVLLMPICSEQMGAIISPSLFLSLSSNPRFSSLLSACLIIKWLLHKEDGLDQTFCLHYRIHFLFIVQSTTVIKKGHPQPLFSLFSVISNKQSKFYNKLMWKMSIQYPAPGFELITLWLWVSSFNQKTREGYLDHSKSTKYPQDTNSGKISCFHL